MGKLSLEICCCVLLVPALEGLVGVPELNISPPKGNTSYARKKKQQSGLNHPKGQVETFEGANPKQSTFSPVPQPRSLERIVARCGNASALSKSWRHVGISTRPKDQVVLQTYPFTALKRKPVRGSGKGGIGSREGRLK